MKLKIIPNPNKEEFEEIKQMVKNNEGFCPCLSIKTPDTLCMCRAFREQETEGFCHCGLYQKIKTN